VSRLRQSPSTPWRRVGNEIILAPRGRDDFDRLSETASFVWSILETPCTLEDLVEAVAETYSVPAEGIAPDIGALVADLLEKGVIEEVNGTRD
jgi:coenzyme PQQ synthesis protein D (PqqD)